MSGRDEAEGALRRIEERIAALDAMPDSRGRTAARDILEAVLDLHGLALARFLAIVAASDDGDTLLQALAADEQVAALLLLHGLHPELPEARVRKALQRAKPKLAAQGADLQLIEVSDGVARLRLRMPGASREETAMVRREIEDTIVEAAPDLEEIAILNEVGNGAAPAAS
jgi:hypothetical protein